MTLPRLHRQIEVRAVGEDSFLLDDRRTGRQLPLDAVQAEVAAALDGTRDAQAIAEAVLEDPDAAELVEKFVQKLAALCLLDGDVEAATLAERQSEALAREAAQKRDQRLVQMVRWAASAIPFHRERLSGLVERVRGVADLSLVPTMGKRELRENFPVRLLPDGVDLDESIARGEASLEATSGTSDERLQVVFDHTRPGYHLTFPGIRSVEGGWPAMRMALFTTPICSGTVCHMGGMPYEERLDGERNLTFNSSDRVLRLTRAELDDVLADWERFRPNVLRCDPVYAAALVRALEREKLPIPPVQAIWTGFEYCSVVHRRILERAFRCPVVSYYGGTDIGGSEAAFDCENGRWHVWEDAYWLEFLDGDRPVGDGALGEVVVTSLRNRMMPVIRYRIGDLARPIDARCGCMHDHWRAFQLEGRIKDCLTVDGRRITTRDVDELFRQLSFVDFYQLAQRGPREFELLAVRSSEAGELAADEKQFRERAAALLGATPNIRYVREIPVEKSFKYRLTVPLGA